MTHIQQRRDPAAIWTMNNPVLWEGEMGHESDTGKSKMGDGFTAWNDLPYRAGVRTVAGKTGDVSLVVADVEGAAPTDSPTLTGTPTAPTPATSSDSTRLATTGFVKAQEYATILSPFFEGNPQAPTQPVEEDSLRLANTAWVKNVLAESPALGGNPTATTPPTSDNDTSIATTAWVKSAVGLWVDYEPIVSNCTVGTGGKVEGRYTIIGKTLLGRAAITFGSGFSIGSAPSVSMPQTLNNAKTSAHNGRVAMTSAGSNTYKGEVTFSPGWVSAWVIGNLGAFQTVGPTHPFTWKPTDFIEFSFSCELA